MVLRLKLRRYHWKIKYRPRKTYDATYSEIIFILFGEIEKEGTEEEQRTQKATFKISGGGGGGSTTSTLKIEYVTKSPLVVTTTDKAIIKYNFSGQILLEILYLKAHTHGKSENRQLQQELL